MNRKIIYLVLAGAMGACTPFIPQELTDARRAYGDAAHGPAMQMAPAELHKAEESLAKAERSYNEDPKSQRTRDLAYIADRKARTADAIARGVVAERKKNAAERDFSNTQGQIIGEQRTALQNTNSQLTAAQRAEFDARNAAAQKDAELGKERNARVDAERKANDAERAAKDAELQLTKLAMVKEESRGLVITLSGSVLFASNQAVLLPDAQVRLDQVAAALLATKERKLVIEGYTDSRGSDTYNLDLSRRRAEAVRAYLVSKGYDSDLVSSEGMGKARPVSDNTSAEGRANNRRVEIVIKNKGD